MPMKDNEKRDRMDTISGGQGFAQACYSKCGIIMSVKAVDQLKSLLLQALEYHKTQQPTPELQHVATMKSDYEVEVNYSDLMANASHSGRMAEQVKQFNQVSIRMPTLNAKTHKMELVEFPRLALAEDHPEDHMVTFRFARPVMFYLLRCEYGVHSVYTPALMAMKSLHTMRMYLYLSCWVSAGRCTITYLQLMRILCPGVHAEELKYMRMGAIDQA